MTYLLTMAYLFSPRPSIQRRPGMDQVGTNENSKGHLLIDGFQLHHQETIRCWECVCVCKNHCRMLECRSTRNRKNQIFKSCEVRLWSAILFFSQKFHVKQIQSSKPEMLKVLGEHSWRSCQDVNERPWQAPRNPCIEAGKDKNTSKKSERGSQKSMALPCHVKKNCLPNPLFLDGPCSHPEPLRTTSWPCDTCGSDGPQLRSGLVHPQYTMGPHSWHHQVASAVNVHLCPRRLQCSARASHHGCCRSPGIRVPLYSPAGTKARRLCKDV